MQAYLKKQGYLLLITWPDSCLLDKVSLLKEIKKKENLISLVDAYLSSPGAVSTTLATAKKAITHSTSLFWVAAVCVFSP